MPRPRSLPPILTAARPLALLAVVLLLPSPGVAQQRTGPWLGVGLGGTTRLEEAEYSIVERVGPSGWLRGGLALESGHLVGVEWSRGWYSSPLTRVNRQSLLLVVQWPMGPGGESHLRGGAGAGRGTVVSIEPEDPQGPGSDRVVSIGEVGGAAAMLGFSWRVPVRGRSVLAFSPGMDLHVQRVSGETQAGVTASVGLLLGGGFGRPARPRASEGGPATGGGAEGGAYLPR